MRRAIALLALSCGMSALPSLGWAQLAEKPSYLVAKRQGRPALPMPGPVDRSTAALASIETRAQFESIARRYGSSAGGEIVHAIFAIDRRDGDKIHYINTNRYALHEDFLRGQRLVNPLDHKTLLSYYADPGRRFLFGTLGHYAKLDRWVFEFWEGDRLTPELLNLAGQRIAASFRPAAVSFKANSTQQEAVAHEAQVPVITEAEILGQAAYMPFNAGAAQGRLRLVADIESDAEDDIEPTDIVVLREVPLAIPPVAGIVTERPSTALSHVNVLAKTWGIPNAYVREASAKLARLNGQWVRLRVGPEGFSVEPAKRPAQAPRRTVPGTVRPPQLDVADLQPLSRLRRASAAHCGAKASTLGEVEHQRRLGRIAGIAEVPDGFCIPYAHYARFMRGEAVQARIRQAWSAEGFERSRVVRRRALEVLRRDLADMPVDDAVAKDWVAQWRSGLDGRGVFVRSSSNAEDLPRFSGAGLFSTVPNVTRDEDLVKAVLAVWASVFNFEAVEARRHAGVDSGQVFMAVFVQRAVDSAVSGVMATRDPFDATHRDAVYVSAKRGIGIKVVEGRRIAEQSMVDGRSGAVRRLSRSAEDSALRLDAAGGVVEAAVSTEGFVLQEADLRSLAAAGKRLKTLLGGVDQDIEWAIDPSGRVVILQSRPLPDGTAARGRVSPAAP